MVENKYTNQDTAPNASALNYPQITQINYVTQRRNKKRRKIRLIGVEVGQLFVCVSLRVPAAN